MSSTSDTTSLSTCETGIFDKNLQCLDSRMIGQDRGSFDYYTTWSAMLMGLGALAAIFHAVLPGSQFSRLRRGLLVLALSGAANSFGVFMMSSELMAFGENIICSDALQIVVTMYALREYFQTHLMMHVAPVIASLLVVVSLIAAPYRAETSASRIVLTGILFIAVFVLVWGSMPVPETICTSQVDQETVERPRVRYLGKLNALYGRTEVSTLAVFVVSVLIFLAGFSTCYSTTIPRLLVLREIRQRPLY